MKRALWISIIGLLLLTQKGYAQNSYVLVYRPDSVAQSLPEKQSFSDTVSLKDALDRQLLEWRSVGHLEASIDHLQKKDSLWIAGVHLGPRYWWHDVSVSGLPEELAGSPARRRRFSGKTVRQSELEALRRKLVEQAAARGYPFATAELDVTPVGEGQLNAHIRMEPGRYYVFDSLTVKGDVRIDRSFLMYRLNLRPGSSFDAILVDAIPERLQEIPFLSATEEPALSFRNGKAQVVLEVQPKAAGRFDFLIGVLPNSPLTGRLLITGDLEAELINSFGRGERLYASYERLRPETQELDLEFSYPYLLGLPFGVDASFGMYKRDTTFLNVGTDVGVQYFTGGNDELKVFFNNSSTNLLSVDTARIAASGVLPQQLDTRRSSFGIGVHVRRLDYRFNPRRGWSLRFRGDAGMRRILRNNEIAASAASDLYDEQMLRSAQYRLEGQGAYFQPVFRRSTLLTRIRTGFLVNDSGVLRNEQFRLGGNRLLRGFDEEFFFATHYVVGTLEYRLLLGRNSYLFLFGDYAWLEDTQASGDDRVSYPFGFGTGITFETEAGVFGLSAAVGGTRRQPVDFGAPKVHFGYVSLF